MNDLDKAHIRALQTVPQPHNNPYFFTFWGLAQSRNRINEDRRKIIFGKMFGMMLPSVNEVEIVENEYGRNR